MHWRLSIKIRATALLALIASAAYPHTGQVGNVHNHFSSERHLVDRQTCKSRRSAALAEWRGLMV